jgi:hypothetical protein
MVSGAGTLAVMADLVSDRAAGSTNNGWMRFVFGVSLDGATYTTATNAFNVDVPVLGLTRVVCSTNIAASVVESYGYARLQAIGHTNLGAYYVTNLTYRFRRN